MSLEKWGSVPSPGAEPSSLSSVASFPHPNPPPSPSYFVVTHLPLTVSYNLPGRAIHWLRASLLRREWTCLLSLPGFLSLPERSESGRLRVSVLKCSLFKIIIIFCLPWISSSKSKWCPVSDHIDAVSRGVREASLRTWLPAVGQAMVRGDKECPLLLQENFKFRLRTFHLLQINFREF